MATTRTATRQGVAAQPRTTGARAARSRAVSAPRLRPRLRPVPRAASTGPRGVAAPTVAPSPGLRERFIVDAERPASAGTGVPVTAPASDSAVRAAASPAPRLATRRPASSAAGGVRLTERGLLLVLTCFAVLAATTVVVLAAGFFSVSNAPLPDRGTGTGVVAAAGGTVSRG